MKKVKILYMEIYNFLEIMSICYFVIVDIMLQNLLLICLFFGICF